MQASAPAQGPDRNPRRRAAPRAALAKAGKGPLFLVAVDGSKPSGWALAWAARLAPALRAKVALVAVAPPVQVLAPTSEWGLVANLAAQYVRDAETVLADAAETLRDQGVLATTHLERGTPTARIQRLAKRLGASLMLLGSHSRSSGGALRLGSVADAMRHQAGCSVLIARNPPPVSRIVAATDASAPSRLAVAEAMAWGAALKAPVTLVHAVDLPIFGRRTKSLTLDDELAQAVRGRMRDEDPQGHAEHVVVEGPAATAIIREARRRKAGLVVVGSRGRGGLRSLVLGSVSNRVSHDAPCTVLVVKG